MTNNIENWFSKMNIHRKSFSDYFGLKEIRDEQERLIMNDLYFVRRKYVKTKFFVNSERNLCSIYRGYFKRVHTMSSY